MVKISKEEFKERIEKIQERMEKENLDLLLVYGDEYRKENLRYVSNYWPIFERGAAIISLKREPIIFCAPEGEEVAKEMSVWPDIRNLKEFAAVTVPEEIDYPLARYAHLKGILQELSTKRKIERIGIVGLDALAATTYEAIKTAWEGKELIDANRILTDLRLIKTENEIACLREAWRIADIGYEALMKTAVPGNSELQATGAAEAVARAAGAEAIIFMVFGSGKRTNTIVGRPTQKIIEDGDMLMASFAVQYEGYVATTEFPFVAGKSNQKQKEFLDILIQVEDQALKYLKAGVPAKEFVKSVKDFFRKKGMERYDIYPPLHGCGCAEAESPYPDEKSDIIFQPGMTVNTDISLFGHPVGSNRIEEGFYLTEKGAEPFSLLVRRLCQKWLTP